jgi:hypothetical protein
MFFFHFMVFYFYLQSVCNFLKTPSPPPPPPPKKKPVAWLLIVLQGHIFKKNIFTIYWGVYGSPLIGLELQTGKCSPEQVM